MKSPYRFGKRDAVEPEIVKGLRDSGYKVLLLDTFDAMILTPRGSIFMVDFKSPDGKPKPSQLKLIAEGWPLHFVTTTEQALEIVGSR